MPAATPWAVKLGRKFYGGKQASWPGRGLARLVGYLPLDFDAIVRACVMMCQLMDRYT